MTRATGPFTVHKYDRLSWTEWCVRANNFRVLTIHDGMHNISETAAFFGAVEDLYQACKGVAPLARYIEAAMGGQLKVTPNITEEKANAIIMTIKLAFAKVLDAVAKAEAPAQAQSSAANLPDSSPTYEELVNACSEIRRVVGEGYDTEDPSGPYTPAEQLRDDLNTIVDVLDTLKPKRVE